MIARRLPRVTMTGDADRQTDRIRRRSIAAPGDVQIGSDQHQVAAVDLARARLG